MKRLALVCALILISCEPKHRASCPGIEKLAHRNPVADARTASAKGDRHLLMLGGFVGTTPGVQNANGYPTRMMEGTSDTATDACRRQGIIAETYATKYNETIVGHTGG